MEKKILGEGAFTEMENQLTDDRKIIFEKNQRWIRNPFSYEIVYFCLFGLCSEHLILHDIELNWKLHNSLCRGVHRLTLFFSENF